MLGLRPRILQLLCQRSCGDIFLCSRKKVERNARRNVKSGKDGDDDGQSHDLPFQQPDQGVNPVCKTHRAGVTIILW